mgnify:CR=1 FL=1
MIKFGTGGWRAVIGIDFICDNVRRVAAGILALAKEQNKTDLPRQNEHTTVHLLFTGKIFQIFLHC